jgi:phosphatidylserine/phosphatidylglycerophosphate/cardiolipin synthase-like enzyme
MAGIDDRWLDRANASDLELLARALEDGRLVPPFTAVQVQQIGLHRDASTFLLGVSNLQEGQSPTGMGWILRRLAKERRDAERRWSDVAQLVWSGPTEGHEPTRDTRLVLTELFAKAEHHVVVSSFVIYDGRSLFASLAQRCKDRPELQVDFYVNIKSTTGDGEDADLDAFLDDFSRKQWPSGVRLPSIYYDPETLKQGKKQTSLHAKCVVVDERWAFVTSANFTDAAQERNIEAGVLLNHPGVASALAGRFRALRDAGRVKELLARPSRR